MRYSFDTYIPGTPSQERALKIARHVSTLAVTAYNESSASTEPAIVVFSGKPGVGKTHLIEAIRGELDERGVAYDSFASVVPHRGSQPLKQRVILGDDAFSRYAELSANVESSSYGELSSLKEHVLNDWYPEGSLVVISSNFALATIQEQLTNTDPIGRATSRLIEMAKRGADVPISGQDYRAVGEVDSLF